MAIGELIKAGLYALGEAASAARRAWERRRQEQAAAALPEAEKLQQEIDRAVDAARDPEPAAPDAPAPADPTPVGSAGAAESFSSNNPGSPEPQ